MSDPKSKKRGIARYNEVIAGEQIDYLSQNGPVKRIPVKQYLNEKKKKEE
jgi:hypothetical protein